MALYNFTEKEIETLKEVIASQQRSRQNPPTAREEKELGTQSPEVYIAFPTDDIPALTQGSDGVGSTGTGTGTGDPGDDIPGKGNANIYKIDKNGVLQPALPKPRVVYNLSESVISQNWINVARTKFGKWIALTTGPGDDGDDGTIIVRFELLTVDGNEGTALILSRPVGIPVVPEEGDCIIDVIDLLGCLTLQVELRGYAAWMTSGTDTGCTGTGTDTDTGTGTGTTDNNNWEIISLCCPT
jgi:hypothetical protein